MTTSSEFASLAELRSEFAGLGSRVWLNCQGSAPGAGSVLLSMAQALHHWHLGTFDWLAWESTAEHARERFAGRIGAHPDHVSVMTSLAEAATTVATGFSGVGGEAPTRKHIVVPTCEFRSNLLPWMALRREGFVPRLVECADDGLRTDDIVKAIDDSVALVAVSAVQSQNGARLDLAAVLGACRSAGAKSFVNLTQSLGVIRFDLRELDADYVATHGYKWLLAPRGATWLYVRPSLLSALRPLTPNWKNAPRPYEQLYGVPVCEELTARRLDGSLAWHSWVGADAALALLDRLDSSAVEQQALRLATDCRVRLEARGANLARSDCPSHLVGVRYSTAAAARVAEETLRGADIVASSRGRWLRLGFHGFHTDNDLDRVTEVLS